MIVHLDVGGWVGGAECFDRCLKAILEVTVGGGITIRKATALQRGLVLPSPQGDQQKAYQSEARHLGRLDPPCHTLVEAGCQLFPSCDIWILML